MKLFWVLAACILAVNSDRDDSFPFMRSGRESSSAYFDNLEDRNHFDFDRNHFDFDLPSRRGWTSRRDRHQDDWPSRRYQDEWSFRRDPYQNDYPSRRYQDDWSSRRDRYQDDWPYRRYQNNWSPRQDRSQDDWSFRRDRYQDDYPSRHYQDDYPSMRYQDEWSFRRDPYQDDWPYRRGHFEDDHHSSRRYQNDWSSRRDRFEDDHHSSRRYQNDWSSRRDRSHDGWSNSRTHSCSNNKLRALLNENVSSRDAFLVKSTWESIKKNSAFAPKVFLRYFKASPESQQMFRRFANVPLSDLPTNNDFLLQAYTSVSFVNSIFKYLDRSIGCAEGFPVLSGLDKKYKAIDFKKLRNIWINTLQEELGSHFTPEARNAWENVFKVASIYVTGPTY